MFVKDSPALQDAVDRILTIFEMLIVNLGGLDDVGKLEQWRNAVRDIQWELESVRSIANRTDNIPHMLIGADEYIHWMENISMPGIPFLDWHQALFPPIKSIASHPRLLTIEQQYNAGLQVQPPAPTTEPVGSTSSATPSRTLSASRSSTMPHMTAKGSAGHILTHSTPSAIGMVAMLEEILITQEDDNREESKVVEEDIKMYETAIKPAHG
ncbi:hypothetical protein EDD17DRAFT_1516480 [Pisolithus thermaeus]|nr:hypothetical protein EDD17DRAFT_1516480 [Pisolithus thermaeus]